MKTWGKIVEPTWENVQVSLAAEEYIEEPEQLTIFTLLSLADCIVHTTTLHHTTPHQLEDAPQVSEEVGYSGTTSYNRFDSAAED